MSGHDHAAQAGIVFDDQGKARPVSNASLKRYWERLLVRDRGMSRGEARELIAGTLAKIADRPFPNLTQHRAHQRGKS